MNLRGLISVSGKSGLFKLIGQNKGGFIIESLDKAKIKSVMSMSSNKMATLEDITIYGLEEEIKLIDIFEAITANGGETPSIKDDGKVLRKFFTEIAPDHDANRVYSSDIKKIITWYNIIKELPIFEEETPEPLLTPVSE